MTKDEQWIANMLVPSNACACMHIRLLIQIALPKKHKQGKSHSHGR